MGDVIRLDPFLAAAIGRTEAELPTAEELHAFERSERARTRERNLRDSGIFDRLRAEDVRAILWHTAKRPKLSTDPRGDGRALVFVRSWLRACYDAQVKREPMPHFSALLGPMGSGKTLAAAFGLSQIPGRYMTACDLTDIATATFGEDRHEFARLYRTGLLVIDEIGSDENPEVFRKAMGKLIDQRQGARRRTLLMGNVGSEDALLALLDPRSGDRMKRTLTTEVLDGESMRRRR